MTWLYELNVAYKFPNNLKITVNHCENASKNVFVEQYRLLVPEADLEFPRRGRGEGGRHQPPRWGRQLIIWQNLHKHYNIIETEHTGEGKSRSWRSHLDPPLLLWTGVVFLFNSGGSKGGPRLPPLAQNFFIFMQFLGKIGQNIGWRLPFGVSAPSSGKSWIRYCLIKKFLKPISSTSCKHFTSLIICRSQ